MARTIDVGYPINAYYYQDFNFPDSKRGDYNKMTISNSRVEIQVGGYTVFTKFFPDQDDYSSDRSEEYLIDEAFQELAEKLKGLLQ